MELFNNSADRVAIGFENGGVVMYNHDLHLLQDIGLNSQLAIYGNYNIILSGMLVDTLDVLNGQITITEGYAIIDKLIYKIPAYSGNYPVMLKANPTTENVREYKNGDSHTTTISYSVSYSNIIQTEIAGKRQIVFSPFTANRVEYIQKNMSMLAGETRDMRWDSTLRTTTDTNNIISNGSISLIDGNGDGLFSLEGYHKISDERVQVGAYESTSIGSLVGSNTHILSTDELPSHRHELSTENGDANIYLDNQHSHLYRGHRTVDQNNVGNQVQVKSRERIPQDPEDYGGEDVNTHEHRLAGNTGYAGNTQSFSLMQKTLKVLRMEYIGSTILTDHTSK